MGHATPFPPVETARRRPNGLLAAGGDLSVSRLVDAYTRGIFPWYSEGDPILWWSPDPRMVLFVDELHVARSLARRLKRGDYEVRADTAFVEVMRACAAPRGGEAGTWISEQMVRAYARLHRAGFAHSIETWMEGQLAGGLYGVAIGRMFFGESMFTRRTDASKIALVHLVRQLAHWGFRLVDCQMRTAHIERFGAREIPRSAFLAAIAPLVARPSVPSPWRLDEDLAADGAARRQP